MEAFEIAAQHLRDPLQVSAPSGIVRVLRGAEQRVGLGFLIDERHVVTAAHVVNAALGRDKVDTSNPGVRAIFVEFCLLPGGPRARRTQVDEWHFGNQRALAGKDVATLRLEEPAPTEATPLSVSLDTVTSDVLLFGPVRDQPDGGWLSARVMEAVPGGRVQLNQEVEGIFRVQSGWSGGPVWHRSTHSVLGMLVAKPIDEEGRTDVYAIPSSVLCEALPTKLGHILTGGIQATSPTDASSITAEDIEIPAPDPKDNHSSTMELRLEVLERGLARLATQLNRLERLTILPNYKLPPTTALLTLSDLPEDIRGMTVLIKADIDIAGKLENVGTHFKFARAALTINELISRGAAVLLLWGQGLTSVELLEASEVFGYEWHASRLREYLDDEIPVSYVSSLSALPKGEHADRCGVMFLPNLVDLSPEDILLVKGSRSASRQLEGRAEEFCVQSRLVASLSGHYDAFVLDDFRSTVFQLPSNVGLSYGKRRVIGRGIEGDLTSLERLVERCIYLGRGSTSQRTFICGSSRPDDLLVVETFLQSQLFDRCLLGPYPSLVLFASMGYNLSPSVLAELAQLSALNGRTLDALLEGPGRRLANEYGHRIVLPKDFLVRRSSADNMLGHIDIRSGGLANLSEEERISAVGPETVSEFCDRIDESDLVFHFGMLSRSSEPEVKQTAAVIRRYCESSAEAFMAGDHILAIAHDMGLGGRLSGSVTGAQTTSYYMTGVQLPGLVPFLRNPSMGSES